MNAPNFAKDLGQGTWVGSYYIVHRCPLCSGENTLMFTGRGNWQCLSCGPETVRDLEEFKNMLRKTGIYEQIADAIDIPEAPEGLIIMAIVLAQHRLKGQWPGNLTIFDQRSACERTCG